MFIELYNFFYNWLFNGQSVTFLSQQGQEFATILFCVITLVACIWVCIIPIKYLIKLILR